MSLAGRSLTVSYGAFSCTLEGFDEPFAAMKAIAQYFQELSAEDRYFGAAPPTPDTLALRRIAEQAAQHKVDSSKGENGVILRPNTGVGRDERPETMVETEIDAISASQPRVEKPARGLAPVDEAIPAAMEARGIWPEEAELAALAALNVTEVDAMNTPPEDTEPDLPAASVPAADAAADVPKAAPKLAARAPIEMPDPSDNSVAARLQRIRAARAALDAENEPHDEASEAPEAQPLAIEAAPEKPQIEAEASAPASLPKAREREVSKPDGFRGLRSFIGAKIFGREVSTPLAPSAPPVALADLPTATEAKPAAIVAKPEQHAARPAPLALHWQDRTDAEEDAEPEIKAEEAASTASAASAIRRILAADDLSPTLVAAASAFAKEISGGEEEEEISLSPLEESDLLREIAKLKLEEDTPIVERVSPSDRAAAVDRRSKRAAKAARSEREISRLIGETNTKLDGADTRRRLAAITHLKAAVAATVAERQMKANTGSDTLLLGPKTIERYRDDLAKTAAPIASAKAEGSGDPEEVTWPFFAEEDPPEEDLIDFEAVARLANAPAPESAPKGTRPVSLGIDTTAEELAEFAMSRGAVTLADFMEAVAAFAVGEKGMESFLRPYLLSRVAAVMPEGTYEPELGLRVFGTLLRKGTIQRAERGRFTINEESRFLQVAS